MKICVINGSPKGNYSITIHTMLYLEKLYPEHTFEYLNIGQQIKYFEKDLFKAIKVMQESDLILFSYPVSVLRRKASSCLFILIFWLSTLPLTIL